MSEIMRRINDQRCLWSYYYRLICNDNEHRTEKDTPATLTGIHTFRPLRGLVLIPVVLWNGCRPAESKLSPDGNHSEGTYIVIYCIMSFSTCKGIGRHGLELLMSFPAVFRL